MLWSFPFFNCICVCYAFLSTEEYVVKMVRFSKLTCWHDASFSLKFLESFLLTQKCINNYKRISLFKSIRFVNLQISDLMSLLAHLLCFGENGHNLWWIVATLLCWIQVLSSVRDFCGSEVWWQHRVPGGIQIQHWLQLLQTVTNVTSKT